MSFKKLVADGKWATLWLLPSDRHLDDDNHNYTMFLSGGGGAPWARTTKNVKKPLGEKGRTFRKSMGPCKTFDFLNVCLFSPRHPLESHMCKEYTIKRLVCLKFFYTLTNHGFQNQICESCGIEL